jgi:hypothetical protein
MLRSGDLVEEVGIFKPSRRVYRHAQQVLKLRAVRTTFASISANSWDAKAAASFAFRWPGSTGAAGRPTCIPGAPALELESLEALPSAHRP